MKKIDPIYKKYAELSKPDRRKVLDLQTELFKNGFGKDEDFVQKACFNKALEDFLKNQ